jgi:hypothetical protein
MEKELLNGLMEGFMKVIMKMIRSMDLESSSGLEVGSTLDIGRMASSMERALILINSMKSLNVFIYSLISYISCME